MNSSEKMTFLSGKTLELATRIRPLIPRSDDTTDVQNEVYEIEEHSSDYPDEVNIYIEQDQAISPHVNKSNELQNFIHISKCFKQQFDPNIIACIYAILICNEVKKQRATYLYRWIKSKPCDLIPSYWELIYPELMRLIREFLVANQKLKASMPLKCEEYSLVTLTLNQVLPYDQSCLFDLIKHPNDQLKAFNVSGMLTDHKDCVAEICNTLIKEIFKGLQAPEYVQRVNDRRKMSRRREKNTLRYIDQVRKQNSRLIGVRVDLYLPADKKHFTPKEIVKHFHTILQKLRRSKSLRLKGYVWKLEHGVDQALHIHCFFFFCGSKHREDISLGRMIGEMWDKEIDGKHNYFNCNTSKNRKKYKYDALGVINRDDQTKYDNIAKVIRYFSKFEQYVLHSNLERVKTLNTGILPHLREQMGRPNLAQHY